MEFDTFAAACGGDSRGATRKARGSMADGNGHCVYLLAPRIESD